MNTPSTTPSTQPLTAIECETIIWSKYSEYVQTARDYIHDKLHIWKPVDEIQDIVTDLLVTLIDRIRDGRKVFHSEKEITSYVLVSCWRNHRDLNVKNTSGRRKLEDWEEEGYQTHRAEPSRSKLNLVTLDTVNLTQDFQDAQEEEGTDQDKTDRYYARLWERMNQYLEDCIADGFFTFREVGIYRDYILNDYTMKELIQQSDFGKTVVTLAVQKVKRHLLEVDWKLWEIQE